MGETSSINVIDRLRVILVAAVVFCLLPCLVFGSTTDLAGRRIKLTNNVGAVTWSGRYSGYGIGTVTATGATNPIRAPGQYADPETGLYNNYQRNYDPEVGAYLEEDPFGTFGGPNRYNYGDSSPLRLYDPMGQWTMDDVERALAYTGLIVGGAALGVATVVGTSPILVPLVVTGTIADLGLGAINGYQCYNHFRDPCNSAYSGYDCVDALLGGVGAAGGATALRGLTQLPGRLVPAVGKAMEVGRTTEMLNPFELNASHGLTKGKAAMTRLKNLIAADGKINHPIKYVEINGKKYIVDGHHRTRIAKELGMVEVPAERVELPYGQYLTIEDVLGY